MATKKAVQNEEKSVPLKPCESWDAASELARDALAFILADPREAGGTRVKAAELMLHYAIGKDGGVGETENKGKFEEWLAEVRENGHL